MSHHKSLILNRRGGIFIAGNLDTREQNPFNFSQFKGWFAGIEKRALPLGDYSIAGLENVCVVERKDLSDLVRSCLCRWVRPSLH